MDVLSGGEKQRMAVSSSLLLKSLSVLFCSVLSVFRSRHFSC